jgi:hypothetical protein
MGVVWRLVFSWLSVKWRTDLFRARHPARSSSPLQQGTLSTEIRGFSLSLEYSSAGSGQCSLSGRDFFPQLCTGIGGLYSALKVPEKLMKTG